MTLSAHRSREALVFTGATAVAFVHALDDAFVHRQPGVGLGQHALAAALSLVLAVGAISVYPSLRAGVQHAVDRRRTASSPSRSACSRSSTRSCR